MNHKDFTACIAKHLNDLANADSHPAIEIAEKAVMAAESFIDRLYELQKLAGDNSLEDMILVTVDQLGDVVGQALREEEDDRVNKSFRRDIDANNSRRGLA